MSSELSIKLLDFVFFYPAFEKSVGKDPVNYPAPVISDI